MASVRSPLHMAKREAMGLVSRKELATLQGHSGGVRAVAVTQEKKPYGKRLVMGRNSGTLPSKRLILLDFVKS